MEESRTKKSTRNMLFSFLYKIADTVLAFALRTVFIKTLGIHYLGVNGLFTSILNVLSLMELGVGSAIAFSLYCPLAKKDNKKISALMNLYRKVYIVIGTAVLVVGFSLTPFLSKIVNLPENVEHLYIIYWLSVANTGISYFLSYRRTLLTADQCSYICTKNDILFRFIRFAGLIFILFFTHNYILYLSFDVVNTLISNIVITLIVKKRYPYLSEHSSIKLEKSETKKIVKYMSSTVFTKIGQTVVTSTDSIIISAFISTSLVGYYSNYNILFTSLDTIVYLLFSGITASVGNYAVTNTGEESYSLFKKINLFNYMIVCTIAVSLLCLASPFITIWLGKKYLLSRLTVVIIAINFFLTSNQNSISNFMSARGEMYYKNRYRSLIEGIVNLISSILLVKYTKLGIAGVFIGTTICFVFGRLWMDARILYKYWFQVSFKNYVKCYIKRLLLFSLLGIISLFATNKLFSILGITVFSWIICGLLCVTICSLTFFLLWRKSDEAVYIVSIMKKHLLHKG